MKIKIASWSSVVLLCLVLNGCNKANYVPKIFLTDSRGVTIRSDDLIPNNRYTLVNLWSTWCAPCLKEIPELVKFAQNNPYVTVVFVNQGESISRVTKFLAKLQLAPNNLYFDNNAQWFSAVKAQYYPTSIIYQQNGQQLKLISGALNEQQLTTIFTDLKIQ